MKSNTIVKFMALGGLALVALTLLALMPGTTPRTASATANPLPPLLSCPNVDGSSNNMVSIADILSVVQHYNKNYGTPGYGALWDQVSPYNSTSPAGTGQLTIGDILYVVQRYNQTCPVVDTQVAKATRAIGDPVYSDPLCNPNQTPPVASMNCGGGAQFMTEDATFLATKGYFQGSSDVPGQGVHYFNSSYWDGVFNPTRPEGLVYDNGSLAAHLYVIKGDGPGGVTWGTSYSAPPCGGNPYSCPGAVHGIDLEGTAGGPLCSPACSWNGGFDGWHVHYYLCTVHIGHSVAVAIPGSYAPGVGDTQAHCQSFAASSGSGTQCPVPITSGDVPCYSWGQEIGWMGHLWNWLPNANLIPDNGGTGFNGRFADCYPDGSTWGPFDCPA